jgi:cell division protein FtsI (penicillin-binding protein 3)
VTLPLSYAVGFRPASGTDLNRVAERVSAILPLSRETVRRKLDSPSFVYLARRVDWKFKQHLESLKLKCLQFDQEARRAYPAATALASVIGFANVDGIGQEGIELALNHDLAGTEFQERHWKDARRTSTALLSSGTNAEFRGADVTLTIDLQLQTVVENAMRAGLANLEYERSCAILLDPWSGDILALSTLPTYDPNRPGDSNAANRKCWPITDVYEPGSTLKIIPIAEALESKRVRRSTIIYCEDGAYRVPGATIHDSHPHADLTVDSILAYSSNIGAAKIAETIEPDEFYNRIRAFGFGNRTGIEISGEQRGVVPKPKSWSGPTCSNLAMGHGLSCTPLQMAMAFSAIANGGTLMKPNLVLTTTYPNGSIEHRVPQAIRSVVSPALASELTDMLVNVVEYGTGKTAAVEGLRIAGKTGTAQKVDLENHTYYKKRFISSFIGFFPADDPRYLLLVIVDDPQGEYFGSLVAAPVFKEIAEQLMVIRPQDFPLSPTPVAEGLPLVDPVETAREFAQEVRPACTAVPANYPADAPLVEMPLIEGLPLRRAAIELSSRGLDFQLTGSGIVSEQYPPPGDILPVGYRCRILAQD